MIITNSNTIEDLKTSLNHLYVEIQDLKNDKTKLAEKFSQQQKSLVNLEERIADAERYKQRWCLCLYGLSEQPNKDVKAEVLKICNVLAPESCQKVFDVIDIAHRLGKPQPGRIRAFIILFSLHSVRDAVWRNAKTTVTETTQTSLHGKKARDDNKKAYYIRCKAFTKGTMWKAKR
ncbi:zinc finger 2-like protein [Labeo rohita]|uniref:Zinc finger 2-like protein n=1 Tax=Labeo rohita TaxID=84645 RepID=A0A498NP46_LABRO|nr:zinc finger 2-like protein [Labeo rohita]